MFVADAISFREIVMKEPLPLATIQNGVIDFLRGRNDVALFGAQAVNVYVSEPRATQDVDLVSVRASEIAEELRERLSEIFHIAVRVRTIKNGAGYRLFQVLKGGNRHLVDIRSVQTFPQVQVIEGVQVLSPAELLASKVISSDQRRGKPKSFTDRRDLMVLLLAFPALKRDPGPVTDCLTHALAGPGAMALWQELVKVDIVPENEDDDF